MLPLPRNLLDEAQENPLTFLEIGAAHGLPEHWQTLQCYIKTIGFEPEKKSFQTLQQTENNTYYNTGLGSRKGQATLYNTKRPNVSSLFEPNKDFLQKFPIAGYFEVVGTTEIQIETLDNLVANKTISNADFMQLDTQGSELDILKGGSSLLERDVFGLEIEVEFEPLYKNQPLFSDIDQFLRPYDFYLFDLRPQYFKRKHGLTFGNRQGQLLHADALYLRTTNKYLDILVKQHDKQGQRHKMLAALIICLHYGYIDYAAELVSATNIFSPTEKNSINKHFKSYRTSEKILPDFFGRGTLYTAITNIANYLRPPNNTGRLRRTLSNANIDK